MKFRFARDIISTITFWQCLFAFCLFICQILVSRKRRGSFSFFFFFLVFEICMQIDRVLYIEPLGSWNSPTAVGGFRERLCTKNYCFANWNVRELISYKSSGAIVCKCWALSLCHTRIGWLIEICLLPLSFKQFRVTRHMYRNHLTC